MHVSNGFLRLPADTWLNKHNGVPLPSKEAFCSDPLGYDSWFGEETIPETVPQQLPVPLSSTLSSTLIAPLDACYSGAVSSQDNAAVFTTTVPTATQFPEFGQRQTGKEPDRPSPMGNCEPAEVSYCARNRPIDSFPVIKINQFSPQHNSTQFNPQTTQHRFQQEKK